MKCIVDISIEHEKSVGKGKGTGTALIWTEMNGRRRQTGPYVVMVLEETRDALALKTVNEALRHFVKKGQEIEIRMKDSYVRRNLPNLKRWHENGYKGSRGRALSNEKEWRLLWMALQNQNIVFESDGTV